MAHQFPDNNDYKRGLVDMLEALTVEENGVLLTFHAQAEDVSQRLTPIIEIALTYRKELADKAKLNDMINTLRIAGYAVHNPAHVPTVDAAKQYLEANGYRVTKIGIDQSRNPNWTPAAPDDAMNGPGRTGMTHKAVDFDGPS